MDLSDITPKSVEYTPYHHGVAQRTWQVDPELREFVAWDGEGLNVDGDDKPQHYVLFGSSHSSPLVSESHLHTFTLLDYILRVGREHPTAFHVSFAFNYDATQILRSLSTKVLEIVHKTGKITLQRQGQRYFIHYLPGKWFSVSRYEANYDRKSNPHAKTTVRIYDLFSFFGTSFVKAYEDTVGAVPDVVRVGKADRDAFVSKGVDYVLTYWRREIEMLCELAHELRKRMYGADLRIREWHGPGALASYVNRKHGIRAHMSRTPDEVREAARYGYAGGRFERFKLGRVLGPIYSMDINSAYPHAIRYLPSLTAGTWKRVDKPQRLARFGIYRVRVNPRIGGSFLESAPGPLFHRDKMGNISFPWITEGWYWSPEVREAQRLGSQVTIIEGWEYVGWKDAERPYAFVEEAYETRRKWKEKGYAAQLALKLMLNSLYGKMAQRVGWNEETRTAPAWHQLEWAGYVTSYCRAMLWNAMSRMASGAVIAVETDGIYTTQHPATILGSAYGRAGIDGVESGTLHSSNELGGWEVDVYDEILYVESGLAWLRKGECPSDCTHDRLDKQDPRCAWVCKRRGLDAGTFKLDDCRDYLRTLQPMEEWAPYVGSTHRFIGLGAALASSQPTKERLALWETVPREIRAGRSGKRVHIPAQCSACKKGLTAWEAPHDMTIRSLAYKDPRSKQHDIPWENGDQGYAWRNVPDIGEVIPA